jgi:hypothetical protein
MDQSRFANWFFGVKKILSDRMTSGVVFLRWDSGKVHTEITLHGSTTRFKSITNLDILGASTKSRMNPDENITPLFVQMQSL